jgi:hypothetical protein
MSTGKLKNLTRRVFVANLSTQVAPVRHLFNRREEHSDGTWGSTEKRVVLPDSITILTGQESESLPVQVTKCPEIEAAINERRLKWTDDPAPEPVKNALKAAAPEPARVHPGEHVDEQPVEEAAPSPVPTPRARRA